MTGSPAPADGGRASRLTATLDLLATRGRVSVEEAAAELGVSAVTVRRDFTELTKRQLVTRHHGGITAAAVAYELPFRYRSSQQDERLQRIAAAALEHIPPGSAVAMNGGTTTSETARALTARTVTAAGGTLVTNALNIAAEAVLRPEIEVVQLGGVARRESYEVTGPLAGASIQQMWFDLAVIGVTGIGAQAGATCEHQEEAATVRAMVERASQVLVVADAPKVGHRAFATICTAAAVDVLVTTRAARTEHLAALAECGVEIVLA